MGQDGMGRVGQWAELTSFLPIQMIHILGVSHPPPHTPPSSFAPELRQVSVIKSGPNNFIIVICKLLLNQL
jgi:hypothetical protein